jgi:penicillin-binding protein-related factor A (putative recombinase)
VEVVVVKKPKKVTNRDLGRLFEKEVERSNEWYYLMGKALLFRLHTPTRYKGGKTIYTERTPCDYMGYLYDGRVILLEAKSTVNTKIKSWKADKEHQWDELLNVGRHGGIGLFILKVGQDTAYLFQPSGPFGARTKLSEMQKIKRGPEECPWPWFEELNK